MDARFAHDDYANKTVRAEGDKSNRMRPERFRYQYFCELGYEGLGIIEACEELARGVSRLSRTSFFEKTYLEVPTAPNVKRVDEGQKGFDAGLHRFQVLSRKYPYPTNDARTQAFAELIKALLAPDFGSQFNQPL